MKRTLLESIAGGSCCFYYQLCLQPWLANVNCLEIILPLSVSVIEEKRDDELGHFPGRNSDVCTEPDILFPR